MRIVAVPRRADEFLRLKAAGADAVLMPVAGFSAGAAADFPAADFPGFARSGRAAGVSVYAELSAPIHEADLAALTQTLDGLAAAGVAAIVCADVAVVQIAVERGYADKIVYQPGTFNANAHDAAFYRRRGIKGITLSHRIDLAQIAAVAASAAGIELSLVGHGHLPMFHARRRFVADYRERFGLEAGADSAEYALEEAERPDRHYPLVEDASGTILYRDRRLMSYAELPVLAGILADLFVLRRFLADDEYFEALSAYADPARAAAFLARYGAAYDAGFYHRGPPPAGAKR